MKPSTINEQDFITAYTMYADAILRYCFFKLYDREKAKDVVQEAFIKTWQYLADGKKIDNLRAFIYKVAHNLCINELKRNKPASLEEMQDLTGYEPADTKTSSETSSEISLLMSRLKQLKPADQELISLRYISDLPVSEIAKILDEAPNTVSVRIKRALETLRNLYI